MKAQILTLAFAFSTFHAIDAHAQTAPAPVPDTQIAKIILTVDDGEIDAAKIAKKHAQSQEVKDFANMMADQHEKSIKETKHVAKMNKINPEDSDMSKALKNDAKDAAADLKRQDKSAFDRAYIKQQIMMHEKVLATLKEKLIPDAQNKDLKAHLEKTQAAVIEHLDHAKQIESKLQ